MASNDRYLPQRNLAVRDDVSAELSRGRGLYRWPRLMSIALETLETNNLQAKSRRILTYRVMLLEYPTVVDYASVHNTAMPSPTIHAPADRLEQDVVCASFW